MYSLTFDIRKLFLFLQLLITTFKKGNSDRNQPRSGGALDGRAHNMNLSQLYSVCFFTSGTSFSISIATDDQDTKAKVSTIYSQEYKDVCGAIL